MKTTARDVKRTAKELSIIAHKAVETLLNKRLKKLSKKNLQALRQAIEEYYTAKTSLDFDLDAPTIIYHELRATTIESFLRFGDRNCLTASIKRNYIKPAGTPLDVQNEQLDWEYGNKTSIQDFVDFMIDYPYGKETFDKAIKVQEQRDRIKSFTGFVATHKFIERLNLKMNPQPKHINHDPETGF